jgi:hypothetical protein
MSAAVRKPVATEWNLGICPQSWIDGMIRSGLAGNGRAHMREEV